MLVLGLQGSPRKKGNSNYLMRLFLERARELGARTEVVDTCLLYTSDAADDAMNV